MLIGILCAIGYTGQNHILNPAEESQAFLQLAKLCQDHTLVGMKLLDKISSVPAGELACSKLRGWENGGGVPSGRLRNKRWPLASELLCDPGCNSKPTCLGTELVQA